MKAKFRPLQGDDLQMILGWRNHDEIRRFMFQQTPITLDEHLKWFQSRQENTPDSQNPALIYEEAGRPCGFMQFNPIYQGQSVFEWGFYIDPKASVGTGSRMCAKALSFAFQELQAEKVFGEVLSFNVASIKLHRKLGFSQEGLLRDHYQKMGETFDVFCFGLVKTEWQAHQQQTQ